ncbi:helix-turn-helix domain-containing protein [Pseudothauera rhizosphaerae]|uniref:Helix-turn-helix transcriptional regulator n=1 Tax=Pseudothauera rhizosphaerae TaxID=2565932 RepID=A0A4S4A9T2_9RHOO|nr:AraC family transcriptional regulator [Pseudothauera rhizosphaerae]THF55628.1 helix-turn-helix transcriptional regulator [Pseudothauera rhizosphaerae]
MFASPPPAAARTARRKKTFPTRGFAAGKPPSSIDGDRLGAQVGRGHQLLCPNAGQATPLMQGSFSLTPLRDGMSLHCTDVVQLQDMTTQYAIEERSIKVMLRLEGNAQVMVGRQVLPLDAGQAPNAVPRGAVVTLNAPDTLQRQARAGGRQRMVVLTLRPAWFDALRISPDVFREHVSVRPWEPSRRATAIAEQLIHPLELEGPILRLHQESRALELIVEALSQTMTDMPHGAATLPAGCHQRVRRLQAFLDSGEADHLDLRAIAVYMGCNANTLQHEFRDVCGQSIYDYLRCSRLRRAAHALQHEGVSVARAAEIAGYSNQANFSTAFRRHFGLPPKHCRNRV